MQKVMNVYSYVIPQKNKAYKCLNYSTNKVVESANVRVDEFVERGDTWCTEEFEDNSAFIYVDDDSSNTQSKEKSQALSSH